MAITFFKKKQPTITNIQNEILHNTTISTNIASIIAEYAHEYSYSHKLATYPQLISIMTLLSDGKMAVSASDGIIRILDIITGKCYCKLAGHVNNIISVIELANKNIASSSYDNTIRIWDIPEKRCIKRYDLFGCKINTIAELPDTRLAIATCTGEIVILHPEAFVTETLYGHTSIVYDIKVFNNKMASCSADGTVRIWYISNEIYLIRYLCCHPSAIYSVAWLSDDAIVYGTNDAIINVWGMKIQPKFRRMVGHEGCIYSLKILSDDILVSGSGDNTICIWDINSGKCLQKLRKHSSGIRNIIIYNDSIISGSYGGTIKIWK